MRKRLVLLLILVLGISLENCHLTDCPKITEAYFDIQGISVDFFLNEAISPWSDTTEIDFDSLSHLELKYEVEYISCQPPAPTRGQGLSLISSAYGTSCDFKGHKGSKEERLDELYVITLLNYDEEHHAFDTINDLVKFTPERRPHNAVFLNDYLDQDTSLILVERNAIVLEHKPTADDRIRLKVMVYLSNNERYEATTDVLKVK